jgi:SRSO17 transposase
MNRTDAPELTPDVLRQLEEFAAGFRADFNRPRQAAWCGVYLRGLIQDGHRKSAEPMAARVPLPPGLDVADPEQALQQFLGQSTWDERAVLRRYRAMMATRFGRRDGRFVIGVTAFPKKGSHSVGVQRQACGAASKKANCQCAVSVYYVSPSGHYPLDMRLYLPDSWLADPAQLDQAGVPEDERRRLTRGQIALELLDRVRGEGLPGEVVVADSEYGASGPFRDGLAQRRLRYILGVTNKMLAFAEPPPGVVPAAAPRDRPQERHRPAGGPPLPSSLKDLAAQTRRFLMAWTDGTREPTSGRFAWLRVRPGRDSSAGPCAGAEPIWLLIEEQADGELEYAFSDLPSQIGFGRVAVGWRSRRWMERGINRMKEELGLDHHEGRSWRGFHHHACLVMLAYGFLTLEPPPARRGRSRPGREGGAPRR